MTRTRMSRAAAGREAGFTLLEVLFAMTMFALVSTAVNVLAINAMRQTLHNRHGTTAVMLAQQEVENLRGRRYDTIVDETTTATVAGIDYTVETEVSDDTPEDGMKQITITVSWTGLEGSQSYEVETIFTSLTS